ncbi:MAG: hypothetical protein ABH878_04455 [bacterium]
MKRAIGWYDPPIPLASGDVVRGRVVADLGAGRYRVGIGSQVVEAHSDLELLPGSILIFTVDQVNGELFLRIQDVYKPFALSTDFTETPT